MIRRALQRDVAPRPAQPVPGSREPLDGTDANRSKSLSGIEIGLCGQSPTPELSSSIGVAGPDDTADCGRPYWNQDADQEDILAMADARNRILLQ
jgi:hypothetical protein